MADTANLWGDALAAAQEGSGYRPRPQLPSARPVPAVSRSAPGDALLEAAGGELFLIV